MVDMDVEKQVEGRQAARQYGEFAIKRGL